MHKLILIEVESRAAQTLHSVAPIYPLPAREHVLLRLGERALQSETALG
jgi:hypothetical protein